MTAVWMGFDTVRAALDSQRMLLTGDAVLASNMQSWLGLSPFAKTPLIPANAGTQMEWSWR